jgi:hypothetical protein
MNTTLDTYIDGAELKVDIEYNRDQGQAETETVECGGINVIHLLSKQEIYDLEKRIDLNTLRNEVSLMMERETI